MQDSPSVLEGISKGTPLELSSNSKMLDPSTQAVNLADCKFRPMNQAKKRLGRWYSGRGGPGADPSETRKLKRPALLSSGEGKASRSQPRFGRRRRIVL